MTPFARAADGRIELRIGDNEAAVLRQLLGTLDLAISEGESTDALTRLFPPAYPEDVGAQAEFASVTYDDLVHAKRGGILACVESLDYAERGDEGLVVTLDDAREQAWLRTLNDLRLYLGTKLGVAQDTFDDEPDENDPEFFATQVYLYLGWLQEHLVEVLLD